MHANELLQNFDVELFAVKHEGERESKHTIDIVTVTTMKSYKPAVDKDKALLTLCQHEFLDCLNSALLEGQTHWLELSSLIPELYTDYEL